MNLKYILKKKFGNPTQPRSWILRMYGYLRSDYDYKIFWKHNTPRMKDIEDLRIYEIIFKVWDYVGTSRPQDVGYWGFKDISILSTFRETLHSQDVGFWGSKDIWDMAIIWIFSENTIPWMKDIEDLRMYELLCSFGEHLKTPHL